MVRTSFPPLPAPGWPAGRRMLMAGGLPVQHGGLGHRLVRGELVLVRSQDVLLHTVDGAEAEHALLLLLPCVLDLVPCSLVLVRLPVAVEMITVSADWKFRPSPPPPARVLSRKMKFSELGSLKVFSSLPRSSNLRGSIKPEEAETCVNYSNPFPCLMRLGQLGALARKQGCGLEAYCDFYKTHVPIWSFNKFNRFMFCVVSSFIKKSQTHSYKGNITKL
ncbi:uncharacterized protein LOC108589162 isoform X2 [Callithrix jacchus]